MVSQAGILEEKDKKNNMKRVIFAFIIISVFSCSKGEKEVEYYEDGSKRFETDYEDGVLNGKQIEYFQNGEVKSMINYKDGLMHGEIVTYFENGKIKSIGSYDKGNLTGVVKHFYNNGNIKDEMEWRNNKRHGKNKIYYNNGEIMYTANFASDIRIDTSYFYYENGLLKELKVYKGGEIAYFQFFDKNGEIDFENIEPKVLFDNDTVKLGEELVLTTDVIFDLQGDVFIQIGNYDEVNDVFNSDTTIVKEKDATKVYFKFTPAKVGVDSISVKFNHQDDLDDGSVDGVIKRIKYFVQ